MKMAKTLNIEIEGLCDLLSHRPMQTTEERNEMKEVVKTLAKNPDDKEAYTKEATLSVYKNSKGEICIPSSWIEGALINAGKTIQVQGKGKKTYKDAMKGFVFVNEELSPITPNEFDLDRRNVIVNRGRIMRTRPRIKSGWKAAFTMTLLDDTLSVDTMKEILNAAGFYTGIGDYRPKYGRFKVTKFEVKK
jgi:hypothetical protein